jgi:hypothetical protein
MQTVHRRSPMRNHRRIDCLHRPRLVSEQHVHFNGLLTDSLPRPFGVRRH